LEQDVESKFMLAQLMAARFRNRTASNRDNVIMRTIRGTSIGVWNLLRSSHKSAIVRVVTIKHPPPAVEGVAADNSTVGTIYNLPPQLALLMIAAGWVRSESRTLVRRQGDLAPSYNRRRAIDRRSAVSY